MTGTIKWTDPVLADLIRVNSAIMEEELGHRVAAIDAGDIKWGEVIRT